MHCWSAYSVQGLDSYCPGPQSSLHCAQAVGIKPVQLKKAYVRPKVQLPQGAHCVSLSGWQVPVMYSPGAHVRQGTQVPVVVAYDGSYVLSGSQRTQPDKTELEEEAMQPSLFTAHLGTEPGGQGVPHPAKQSYACQSFPTQHAYTNTHTHTQSLWNALRERECVCVSCTPTCVRGIHNRQVNATRPTSCLPSRRAVRVACARKAAAGRVGARSMGNVTRQA